MPPDYPAAAVLQSLVEELPRRRIEDVWLQCPKGFKSGVPNGYLIAAGIDGVEVIEALLVGGAAGADDIRPETIRPWRPGGNRGSKNGPE